MNISVEGIHFRKATNGTELAVKTVLSLRGIGGTLLPIGQGRSVMMRESDGLLSVSERRAIVLQRKMRCLRQDLSDPLHHHYRCRQGERAPSHRIRY
jgi:hypothetical protein